MVEKHIVAFGGARPVASGMHPLYSHVLSLTDKNRPKVCCIPTATGDAPANLVRFYSRFPASLCEPSHLALFERTVTDIREYLLSQDVIFVLGGNTANMLAAWRVHGVDGVDLALKEAWEAGVVLSLQKGSHPDMRLTMMLRSTSQGPRCPK